MRFNREAGAAQEVQAPGDEDAVIALLPTDDAPAVARRFVTDHRDDLPDDIIDDALLLVSELVTNAVQHGRSAILLRVRSTPPGIGVAVADEGAGTDPVEPRPADDTATSGRGLAIVEALATAWGVDPNDPPPGRTVWFELEAERG